MDGPRIAIGLSARLVFWVMVLFIVGNAAVFIWNEGNGFLAILSVGFFPLTVFLWPFFSPEAASAWPLNDSTGLIYFFVVAAIAYPVSTLIGGLPRV